MLTVNQLQVAYGQSEIIHDLSFSASKGETLAIMGITLLVGLQQWRSPVTRKDFNRVFNEYEQMVYRAIDQTSSGTLK